MQITFNNGKYYHVLVGGHLYCLSDNLCQELFPVELEWSEGMNDWYYKVIHFW